MLSDRPGVLTDHFFLHLLDMATERKPSATTENVYEGRERSTGELKWTATAVDLAFGSHSQLRAIAEVYGSSDADAKFVADFVAAWGKVMNLDRFDLPSRPLDRTRPSAGGVTSGATRTSPTAMQMPTVS